MVGGWPVNCPLISHRQLSVTVSTIEQVCEEAVRARLMHDFDKTQGRPAQVKQDSQGRSAFV